ncbi:MAG TPA: GIY-YIG nuclease family protein [Thermodesulfobacteriota bacterium]|nr:GIY-YIG nuclease family protein [Thermodesulfobacteriota bacterium]
MPQSELKLIKKCAEFVEQEKIESLPRGLRGIYVLYKHHSKKGKDKYDVLYIGMARAGRRGGIRGRLKSHRRRKGNSWSHFSAFEVWDNIRDEEVTELEGLFRHIYRRDTKANSLNVQKAFKKLKRVRVKNLGKWK